MKIGLITFHASHNNGSMLQTLALQHILSERYECDVKIINFSNSGQRNMYSPLPKPKNWRQAIKKMIWATNYPQMIKQYNAYETFKEKYFNLTDLEYLDANELVGIEDEFDIIITGSDQVWNVKCLDADDAYYLNFVSKKPCYAYAVSFGAHNPFDVDVDKYKHLVSKFNKVSVRENNAQKWISRAMGIEVPICLDPTMLLSCNEWEKIVDVGKKPVINGNYIFYYCFSINEEVQRYLKYLSNKTGLPVYFMEAKEWTLKTCWKNKIRLIKEYGPDVYMNVVKHSTLFITTSFHGTAFATIYKKDFWYINDGKPNKTDDRAQSFLTQLGLMGRYKTIEELKSIDLFKSPDYDDAYARLEELQQLSYDYLNQIVTVNKKSHCETKC